MDEVGVGGGAIRDVSLSCNAQVYANLSCVQRR